MSDSVFAFADRNLASLAASGAVTARSDTEGQLRDAGVCECVYVYLNTSNQEGKGMRKR